MALKEWVFGSDFSKVFGQGADAFDGAGGHRASSQKNLPAMEVLAEKWV